MLVSDAIGRFLEHCRIAKRLSPHTLRAYETDLVNFRAFIGAEESIGEIDRDRIRAFARYLFDARLLKETTVRRRMAALKVLFRWLEREEVIPLSPFHRLDMPIRLPRSLPRALTAEEVSSLLHRCALEAGTEVGEVRYSAILMHFIVVCLFTTGLRVGELTGALMADLDVSSASLLVRGKGNRERRVFLPGADAGSLLRRYLAMRNRLGKADETFVVSREGRRVSSQSLRRLLVSLAQRAGLERRVTPHMLRHTAATQLIEAGVDIRFVQKLLGHASIATTQIYTQVSDGSLKAMLEQADTLGRVKRRVRWG